METTDQVKKRMLLIVDPQIDFITGSLPVPGAEEAMNKLAQYVKEHGDEYGHLFVTCDNHNLRHVSFKEFGGKWPPHCIQSTVGAAIWPPLFDSLYPYSFHVLILYKGDDLFQDEYSIFRNKDGRQSMDIFLRDDQIKEVDICGLAGDVCVAKTLEDSLYLYPNIRYRILKDFTASLDGGKYVNSMSSALDIRNTKLS
ncbi:MAG: isochorismatase family protein [Bacteroides sp.]|nr:isochorismatase family protein [Bacteroides sp.]